MRSTVCRSLIVIALATLLSACASPGGGLNKSSRPSGNGGHANACKSTDTQVDNSSQCLQDDAACYELNNGKWCTGERGNVCPAGSTALPAGIPCAPGKRCIRIGESLECAIN